MYFSPTLIEELILELASLSALNLDSVRNLIYHLKLPGEAVPCYIADVLAGHPAVTKQPSPFPGRLAYGVIDHGLLFYDLSQRNQQQAKLCRQIRRIQLYLEQQEQPVQLIGSFQELLALLLFASAAARDLGLMDGQVPKAELAVLVERMLEALLRQAEVTRRLLEHVAETLDSQARERLAQRVRYAVEQGLNNEPWDDQLVKQLICSPNEPVRFRSSLNKQTGFAAAAENLSKCISQLCRN